MQHTEEIKTYELEKQGLSQSFVYKTMQQIALENDGQSDEPHRHNYYTVILASKVQGWHAIDFVKYPFESPCVFFVSPGQVHQVVTLGVPEGYVFLFTEDFLIQNTVNQRLIADLNLFRNYGETPPLELSDRQLKSLISFSEMIGSTYELSERHKYEKLGALVKLFLLECSEFCTLPTIDDGHSQGAESMLRKFRQLVDESYKTEHKVGFYAESLHVTPGHLNKSVKRFTGRNAKEFIQKRITTEAKRMGLYSELSSKEIGFELGFEDPAHFSTFFKNCTGLSFTEFRAKHARA